MRDSPANTNARPGERGTVPGSSGHAVRRGGGCHPHPPRGGVSQDGPSPASAPTQLGRLSHPGAQEVATADYVSARFSLLLEHHVEILFF